MKRSFKNLFMIILILVTSIASGTQTTPVQALGAMVPVPSTFMSGLPTPPDQTSPLSQGYLNGVWGSDASHVFAAGYGNNGSGTVTKPVVYMTTDGTNWDSTSPALPIAPITPGTPPVPVQWITGSFEAVSGTDANHVFAVGKGGVSNLSTPLVAMWDGSSWTTSSPPFPGGDSSSWTSGGLYGVWSIVDNATVHAYAVGYGSGTGILQNVPLISHFNGSSWTSTGVSLPSGYTNAYLSDVWGSSLTDIYAAGRGTTNGNDRPLLFHSTNGGGNWSAVTPLLTLPSGWTVGQLESIWGSSATDIYAVGLGTNAGGMTAPLIYHSSDGINWTSYTPSLPTTSWTSGYLYGVWGYGTDVYAVGFGYNNQVTMTMPLVYRKVGNSWVPSSYPPSSWASGHFQSIWGANNNNVYAVGYGKDSSIDKPLLAHAGIDATPPGSVTNLAAVAGAGSVDLTWIAPADDGPNPPDPNAGPVTSYVVQYSTSNNLTSCEDVDGTPVSSAALPAPVTPGATQTMTVSNLTSGTRYYFSVCARDEENNLSAFAAPVSATPVSALSTGIYDDSDGSAWTYVGTWTTYNGGGPYNNTLHQSGTAGSYAEVPIFGTRIKLTYLRAPGRGSIDVYIDGALVDTINANGTLTWQAVWTSNFLTPGIHTVRFQNKSGGWIDLDAIQVVGVPTPVSAGVYDESNLTAWAYTGTWPTYSGNGPYNNTLHQNSTAGDSAEVYFTGRQFKLTYLKAPGRGSIDVYIDGTKATTINANSSTLVWQATWMSAALSAGNHLVRFQNAVGGWIDLDAIEIFSSAQPITPGTYDDFDGSAWAYIGTWTTYTGSGPYNNTLHQSSTAGSYAEVFFTGTQIRLKYLKASGRGSIDVYIDGALVTTLDANGTLTWQATWTSNSLTPGSHTVRFQNKSGGWIDLDAIQVVGSITTVGQGKYDDLNSAWAYTGTWPTYSGNGPYNNTLHQNSTAGDSAELSFTGMQFKLTYLKAPGRGSIDVYIDGTKVTTINANSSTLVWQATWMSAALSAGNHLVRFQNAVGGWIDLDAIEIFSSAQPITPGTYDDSDGSAWAYIGTWITYSGSGPYSNTLHQSNTTGSYAEVFFTGTQIQLKYLKASGRGSIDVYIDGTLVDTINANGTLTWQVTWTRSVPGGGNHRVRFQNASGGWIDLDAIVIQ